MPSSALRRRTRPSRPRFFTPRVESLEGRQLLSGVVNVSSSGSVLEGNQASFQIQGSSLPAGGVTVYYQTTPGTATAGADYTNLSGSVFLNSPGGMVTVNVTTISDGTPDSGETFSLTLTSVTGGASIGTGSANMTINDQGQPPQGPSPQYITLNSPGTLQEGQVFTLSGSVYPAGYYSLSGSINWGGFVTQMGSVVNIGTSSDGSFSFTNVYYDDGPSPGNDTASDVATIVLNVSVNGSQLSTQTTATVQNAAPIGDFEVRTDGDFGFSLSGQFSDGGTADVHTVTINWGDGSTIETFTSPIGSISRAHLYANTGLTYSVQITIADDDLGSWSWSGNAAYNLVATNMLIERQPFNAPWETVAEGEELSADEAHRWTWQSTIPSGEIYGIDWYYLPWSQWQANPNYAANPLTQWSPFASSTDYSPAYATPPVGDWAIIAKISTATAHFIFAVPKEEPTNRIMGTRWEAGHADQQFYYTDLDYPVASIRVYPEKNTPLGNELNEVKGVVQLARLVAAGFKFTVGFKVLDPDHVHDPESADDGFDPNDVFETPIDIKFNDNRQTSGGWGSNGISPVTTTVQITPGLATKSATFTIQDAQPGNNFILASGHLNDAIHGVGLSTVDGITPQNSMGGTLDARFRSDIMTVWRTLWVELDSMRGPNVMTEGPFDQAPTDAEYDKSLADVPEPQIELLRIGYMMAHIEAKVVPAAEDLMDGNGDPAMGTGWFAHYLDYNAQSQDVPIARAKAASMADWAFANSNEFWVGQLIGAYEFEPGLDNDPDGPAITTFGWSMGATVSSFVFFESSRDWVFANLADPNPPTPCDEPTMYQRVAFHETGHWFGLPDRNGPNEPRGIMNYFDAWGHLPAFHNWTDLGSIEGRAKPAI